LNIQKIGFIDEWNKGLHHGALLFQDHLESIVDVHCQCA
jgi:hypothetical protein